jgi:CheY-specific phosphatase CheX
MKLELDEELLNAVLQGTERGLGMTGLRPAAIGASRFTTGQRPVAVLVGLVGRNSGSVTISMSERAMLFVAGRLLGEEQPTPSDATLDAIMEIGNQVAGSIKENLKDTSFDVQVISVPSLILGASYSVRFARGLSTLSVDFEIGEIPITFYQDRVFTVTISLMRKVGTIR